MSGQFPVTVKAKLKKRMAEEKTACLEPWMPPQQGVFAVPVAALPQQQQAHSQQSYGQSEPTLLNDVFT